MIRKLFTVSVAVVALAGLAACGSSSQPSGASGISSVPASGTAPATPTAVPTVTVTATATPPPPPAAAKPCTTGNVGVKVSSGQGAAGTEVQRFIVTNTSSATCTMDKYPFISPYGLQKQGSTKVEANFDDITVGQIPSDFGDLGGAGGLRTLAPGESAVFFLKWSDVPAGNAACDDADGFDFRPPQDQSSNDNKLVAFKFTSCGGQVQVSQMLSPSVGS